MNQAPQAFFLPAAAPSTGQRFCLFHPAHGGDVRGRVVYVHPFAEEMNKSRHMAALQSRALAAAGFSVLQIDLHGCGDSSGDFGDASWDDWVNDVVQAVVWLSARDAAHAKAPLWMWGLRAGCLIATQAAAKLAEPANFCFWQPASSGKLVLQQFLRLRLAANMLSGDSKAKGLMEDMKQALAKGQTVEVAGYALPSGLTAGLEKTALLPAGDATDGCRMSWFELTSRLDSQASPVTRQSLQTWQTAGFAVNHEWVQGPAFWQTQEIEDAPELIAATCAALLQQSSAPNSAQAEAA